MAFASHGGASMSAAQTADMNLHEKHGGSLEKRLWDGPDRNK